MHNWLYSLRPLQKILVLKVWLTFVTGAILFSGWIYPYVWSWFTSVGVDHGHVEFARFVYIVGSAILTIVVSIMLCYGLIEDPSDKGPRW